MNYELLVLDLDGTLTNSQKKISKPTLDALIKIQEQGKKVVLASGRPTCGITPLANQLRLDKYGGYILSYNGARIIDCRNGNFIYNKTLPMESIRPLYEIIEGYRKQDVDILSYRPDTLLSGVYPNEYSHKEAFINQMPIMQVSDLPTHIDEPVNKLLVTGHPDVLKKVKAEVIEHFRSYLYVYFSEPYFLEIMPPGIDKAHSLLKLLTNIGLTCEEMICCGDGYNDVTMIETAGLGVAMANAQSAVIEKADYITRSNDDDGILHVIEKFLL